MDKILILDFGGQYKQLIARRVRECNVYCEIHPYTLEIEMLMVSRCMPAASSPSGAS